MTVAINGSGPVTGVTSISGLTAGGLPAGSLTPLQSMVRVNTANGYGSTNTNIRRFTTTVESVGTDITYADSATLGASFTINTAGVYAISYTDTFNAAGSAGVSKNTTQPSTGVAAITAADRLAVCTTAAADFSATIATTVYLSAGSVLRPHVQIATTGSAPAISQFTITRIA